LLCLISNATIHEKGYLALRTTSGKTRTDDVYEETIVNENSGGRKVVRLKKTFLVGAVFLGAAIGLQATPVCPTTGTYDQLQALNSQGGCTIGDLTFSGFTYGPPGVPDTALTFTTIDNGPSSMGFLFGVDLSAGPGSSNDIGLGYTVTGSNIEDADLTMAGMAAPPGSGASADIAETICPGHTVAGCLSSLPLSTYSIAGGPSVTSDSTNFAPVGTVGILKDINVIGGSGFASISLFTDTVSQMDPVPEPGFYGVLAAGMGAVLIFARRRKKSV
jgi:hypothetical protein